MKILIAGLFLVTAVQAQSFSVFGSSSEQLGWGVAWLDDVNGDTVKDWAVGGPMINSLAGHVRIFSGANGTQIGVVTAPAPLAGNQFGISVASADVNGDGVRDLIIGETGGAVGSVYVYSGAVLASPAPTPFCTLTGSSGSFGRGLDAVDLNQDTKAEIIVGEDALNMVSIYQHSGGTCAPYCQIVPGLAVPAGSNFGLYLGHADVDGNGAPDILVGSISAGVRLYSGTSCSQIGGTLGSTIGMSGYPRPAGLGDLNGDGFDDFAIGEPTVDTVVVYSGQSLLQLGPAVAAPTPGSGGQFGNQVAPAGDLNGDLIPDFVVAEPFAGKVHVISGAVPYSLLSTIIGSAKLPAPLGSNNALFGAALKADADVNGDGCRDLVIGAPTYQSTGAAVMTTAGLTCCPSSGQMTLSYFNQGPGTIGFTIANGPSNGSAFTPMTLNQGAFPSGWFYGIDITVTDLVAQWGLGYPFAVSLSTPCTTVGPFSGAPSGLTVYGVSLGFPNGGPALPVAITAPATGTVP